MKTLFKVLLWSFIFFSYLLRPEGKIFIRNFKFSLSTSTIQIPVEISVEKNFSGFQLTIKYNSEILKFLNATGGEIVSGFNLLTNSQKKGEIKIAGFDPNLTGVSGTGNLLLLTFTPEKEGVSQIILSNVKLSDKNGRSIPIHYIPGEVRVEEIKQEEEKQKEVPSSKIIKQVERKTAIEEENISEEISILPSPALFEKKNLKPIPYKKKNFSPSRKTSDNCVLLVISEYGNPEPPCGISTFKKGENVKCKVEKEIILNEMEKVICAGYKGSGAIKKGKGNKVEFKINSDTKLTWLWKKVPVEKTFTIEYPENIIFSPDEIEKTIILKANWYGGLRENIKLKILKNSGIKTEIKPDILEYKKRETKLKLNTGDINAGKYKIIFTGKISKEKKEFPINIFIKGKINVEIDRRESKIIISKEKRIGRISLVELDLKYSYKNIEFSVKKSKELKIYYPEKNLIKIYFIPEDKNKTILSLPFKIKNKKKWYIEIKKLNIKNENWQDIPLSHFKREFRNKKEI